MSPSIDESPLTSYWNLNSTEDNAFGFPVEDNSTCFTVQNPPSHFNPAGSFTSQYEYPEVDLEGEPPTQQSLLSTPSWTLLSSPESESIDNAPESSQGPGKRNPSADAARHQMRSSRRLSQTSCSSGSSGRAHLQFGDSPPPKDAKKSTNRKQAHCVIERRYRDKINYKIKQLYYALTHLNQDPQLSQARVCDRLAMREPPAGIRKSDIIDEAINYIHQSEINIRHMADEIIILRKQIRDFEAGARWAPLCRVQDAPNDVANSAYIANPSVVGEGFYFCGHSEG